MKSRSMGRAAGEHDGAAEVETPAAAFCWAIVMAASEMSVAVAPRLAQERIWSPQEQRVAGRASRRPRWLAPVRSLGGPRPPARKAAGRPGGAVSFQLARKKWAGRRGRVGAVSFLLVRKRPASGQGWAGRSRSSSRGKAAGRPGRWGRSRFRSRGWRRLRGGGLRGGRLGLCRCFGDGLEKEAVRPARPAAHLVGRVRRPSGCDRARWVRAELEALHATWNWLSGAAPVSGPATLLIGASAAASPHS